MIGLLRVLAQNFKSFINFIDMAFDFIQSFVKQIGYMLSALVKVAGIITDSINYLPDWLKMFATLTLTICVIYLILGRENGGEN